MQESAFVEENAKVADWPGLIAVGFADSMATGGSPVARLRVDVSSAAALANETDAKAPDINKYAQFI